MPQPERRRRQVDVSPAAVFRDEAFVDETIRLDGQTFERCRFTRCVLQFGGTEKTSLTANAFADCRWVFIGSAALTLEFLSALYRGGAHELIEETFTTIRKGDLAQEETPPNETNE